MVHIADHPIARRNGSVLRNIGGIAVPAVKDIAGVFGRVGKYRILSMCDIKNSNGVPVPAVNQGNFIHVDRACCVNNQIFGRHCFGNVPSRECVSFGYIIRGSYNRRTVFICSDAILLAVDRIGYRIGINAPNSSDGYICSRKNTVFGHSVPSVKGMTELFRIFRNSDNITFISRKREIRLTIDHE